MMDKGQLFYYQYPNVPASDTRFTFWKPSGVAVGEQCPDSRWQVHTETSVSDDKARARSSSTLASGLRVSLNPAMLCCPEIAKLAANNLSGTTVVQLPERQRVRWAVPSMMVPGHWLPLQSHSLHFCELLRSSSVYPHLCTSQPSADMPSQCFFLSLQLPKSSQGGWQLYPSSLLVLLIAEWSNHPLKSR